MLPRYVYTAILLNYISTELVKRFEVTIDEGSKLSITMGKEVACRSVVLFGLFFRDAVTIAAFCSYSSIPFAVWF